MPKSFQNNAQIISNSTKNKHKITLEDRLFGAIDIEDNNEIIGIQSSNKEFSKARTGFFKDVAMY